MPEGRQVAEAGCRPGGAEAERSRGDLKEKEAEEEGEWKREKRKREEWGESGR